VVVCNRNLAKEAYWQEIIARKKESGKSESEFCRDEGLNRYQFIYWKTTLAKRKSENIPDNIPTTSFVPLNVTDKIEVGKKRNSAEQIEISKIVLRVSVNTDKSTLAGIIQSLDQS